MLIGKFLRMGRYVVFWLVKKMIGIFCGCIVFKICLIVGRVYLE